MTFLWMMGLGSPARYATGYLNIRISAANCRWPGSCWSDGKEMKRNGGAMALEVNINHQLVDANRLAATAVHGIREHRAPPACAK
jgi:hypothetical protein